MDLGFLAPLYSGGTPVVSVYLDTTRDNENATREIGLRWRALREQLADQGATRATLATLDDAVGTDTARPGPQGQALFAADGEVLAAHTMSGPPARDRAVVLPIADPVELLVDLDGTMPHVLVAADRTGADVHAYGPMRQPATSRSPSGETLHINKVPSGGWRHKRFQRHTEEVWDRNAELVAQDVEAAVTEVSASVVLVGGDERATGKLREHLSQRSRELVVTLPTGGRADHAAEDSLHTNADTALRELAAETRDRTLSVFSDELGRRGGAVHGVADTAEALRKGQVARLLVAADRHDDSTLWGCGDPMEISTSRARLAIDTDVFHAPAGPVLVRTAYATAAEFGTLSDPEDAMEGVGALLRFELTE